MDKKRKRAGTVASEDGSLLGKDSHKMARTVSGSSVATAATGVSAGGNNFVKKDGALLNKDSKKRKLSEMGEENFAYATNVEESINIYRGMDWKINVPVMKYARKSS